ncbi:MAG: flagellar basal body P-ring protein FlgI [Holophagales bacterium]|nr:flagellar basal body P-ring protein FlgI [Holophagales bacterium]
MLKLRTLSPLFAALHFAGLCLAAIPDDRKVETPLKHLASLQGVRSNQLTGVGIVVGLNGTGDKDQTKFTVQALTNYFSSQGINVDPSQVKVKNVAMVLVTAEMPAFARAGQKIDVKVSSTGDAKNIDGGTLIMTPLVANNNQRMASAQGQVAVSAASVPGRQGTSIVKKIPTEGRIQGGATVEREVQSDFSNLEKLRYSLLEDDFTTAVLVTDAINEELGELVAKAIDPRTIDVAVPKRFTGNTVGLVARLENLSVKLQPKARIVVNEKTGTVIMGADVRVNAVSIVHGNMTIQVSSSPVVPAPTPAPAEAAPAPAGRGQGRAAGRNAAAEPTHKNLNVEQGVTVGQLAESLNAMNITPTDLIAILQAIKDAGALSAELKVI